MTRYLRLCLILLLTLALPLRGMAGVQSPAEPCPMQAMGMTVIAGMEMDCCDDTKSPSEHGKPCKAGQECKTGSMLQVSVVKTPLTRPNTTASTFVSDILPIQPPAGVWRPPCA